MDANKFKRILCHGDRNEVHEDYKGIDWAKKELKEARRISDLEKKRREVEKIYQICDNVYTLLHLSSHLADKEGRNTFNELRGLRDNLILLKNKLSQDTSKKLEESNRRAEICDKCGQKTLGATYYNDYENKTGVICSTCNQERSEYNCSQCKLKREGRYLYNKSKNDSQKFCSDNCYGTYYGLYIEKCQRCSMKLLKSYSSYCSGCQIYEERHLLNKQEEKNRKKTKELEDIHNSENGEFEGLIFYCRFCNSKCPSIFNVCEKTECLLKHDEEYAKKHNIPFDKRERERERERQIQKQKSNLRFSIQQLEQKSPKTPQEEQDLVTKKQELAEFEKEVEELEKKDKKEQSPKDKSNLGLKIGIGVLVGVSLVGLVWFMKRKSSASNNNHGILLTGCS